MAPAQAGLVSREPVKNARSLLRNALPINDRYIREIQVHANDGSSFAVRRCRSYGCSVHGITFELHLHAV